MTDTQPDVSLASQEKEFVGPRPRRAIVHLEAETPTFKSVRQATGPSNQLILYFATVLSLLVLVSQFHDVFAADDSSDASKSDHANAQAPAVPIGAAKVDITPDYPIRLTGYGSRRSESEGVVQKIWAKALAIGGDEGAGPAVLLTIDNCGVTPEITETVATRLKEKVGLRRERMVVCASHTHAAPALTDWAPLIFGAKIPDEHQQRIDRYTSELTDKLTQVAIEALAARKPGRLFWGQGKVDFAANRRVLKEGSWTGFGVQADGPVDRSLPILVAKDAQGELIAVVANYACHCTTLGGDFNQICGDWAGYAQTYIEQAHPTAIAMITIGCGADANPNPRGTLELCQQHGHSLANEVDRLLNTGLKPLAAKLDCRLTHVDLPFAPLPSQEQWQQQAKQSGAAGYHAQVFLERLGKGEELPKSLSYPVGTWTFADDLAMVFLGGEVVVDYAIRLKSEFDADRLWITAYSNDVPCYIPSKRILREGGYEADYSMIYYARPTRFAPEVEDVIVDTVQKLLPQKFYSAAKQVDFPPPKSPAESLAAIKLRPGMQVELVAAEPLVVDPVAFDWGPDGRLWVVEMRDYPDGLDGQGMPGGRIKVLDDSDGDGRYDRSSVFLDNLPFPTGVMVWRSGILVTAAPEIFYAEDTDGDGKADVRETLYQGFGEGNQQHRVNGLRWGLDNWIYVGNGDSGGTIQSVKTGAEVDVRGRDLRIRPDDGLLDAQSGPTQYGRCRDDWGNWFGGNNSNPLWHYVLDDYYLRRNPHFAPPDVRKQVPVQPGAAPVFPASRTLARFNDFDMTQRFTSACSPIIYRDELLAACRYAFVCEPVHNLVHCEIVEPVGVTFTSRRLPDEQQSEFLASTDNWFRPVMIRTGPDGALWIADMYRFVIEHPKWIPAEWQRKLDLRAGDDKGRIYRVYPEGEPPREVPRLDQLDTAGLVAALHSPNGWQRDMAQQMLIWQADQAAIEPLETICLAGTRPTARLHALCTLDGLHSLRSGVISHALSDAHPGVRRHAARLAEPRLDREPALGDALVQLVDDPDPLVQLQVAYSLGQWHDPRGGRALATMARAHQDDAYLSAAVISSINAENVGEIVEAVLAAMDAEPPPRLLIEQLLRVASALGDKVTVNRLVGSLLAPGPHGFTNHQTSTVAGMLAVFGQRARKLEFLLDQATRQQLDDMVAAARRTVADNRSPQPDRLAATELLGSNLTGRPADMDLLGGLLAPQNSPQLQSAAVEALAARATEQSAQQLLSGWRSHSPALRSQILDVLLSRRSWTEQLLAAISRGDVLPGHIDPRRRQQLLQHNDAAIRQQAERLLANSLDASRQKVLEQYRDVATLAGDTTQGQAVFNKRCAACHVLEGVGYAVGPDLTALTDRSPAAMLVAVLDPNRAVEDRFLEYIAVTNDGRQFTGMLSGETGSSITLAGQEGKQAIILRNQLEMLRSSGKSLMPEGVEKDISRQELADLLAYLAKPFGNANTDSSKDRPLP